MTYHELIKKILEQQKKIAPTVEKMGETGILPEQLISSYRAVKDWSKKADQKIGEAEVTEDAVNPEPPIIFADLLKFYSGMFSKEAKEHIALYNEYTEELFQMVHGENK